MKWIGLGALLAGIVAAQGCALFLVGAAVGAGAGTVSYMGNELRTTQEVGMDRAWTAANATMQEMQYRVIQDKTVKDATGGTVYARNAKDQPVRVQLIRQSDRVTEIRVRVGTFDTAANRQTAQLFYDKMKARL
jgi:ABC-type anion transport system duplicated permease subunit